MKFSFTSLLLLIVLFSSYNIVAQGTNAQVHYLGNEGLMIESKQNKVLFDPFFHKNYQRFTLVPEKIRTKIFNNNKPFDNIDAIFISHSHADHFDAKDIATYLKKYPKVVLVAPMQVIEKLKPLTEYQTIASRLHGIALKYGDQPKNVVIGNIRAEAVRIPHVGWPKRTEIENLVYRVTLHNEVTVMHLGDADTKAAHYQPYLKFWQKKNTHYAFIPGVFATATGALNWVNKQLNIKNITYIHLPAKLPQSLKQSMKDYFSVPGETRKIKVSGKVK